MALFLAITGAALVEACFLGSSGDNPGPTPIDAGRTEIDARPSADGAIDASPLDATHDTSVPDVAVPDVEVPDVAVPDAADAAVPDADASAQPDAADASDAADAADVTDAADASDADASEPVDAADASDAFVPAIGCADGTREGFVSAVGSPHIAGCAGAWSVPGITGVRAPQCARAAGNSGTNSAGTGCGVADLCAAGWHVCQTPAEVASHSSTGCAGAVPDGGAPQFFSTAQSGPGTALCAAGANDLFGCGTLGDAPNAASCGPLDRFSQNGCSSLGAPWSCGSDGFQEATNVTKTGLAGGGVLCCEDTL